MVELGQLEAQHAEFDKRNVRIVAASLDGVDDSAATQKKLPHLTIMSDADESLAKAADIIGPQRSPTGGDTVSPTTVLLDRSGQVRWVFRPDRYITRLTSQELAAAIDAHLR
jgi:peroxiredoxin